MSKMSLEEATLKALYDELDDSKDITDVDGLVEDILVITDPEVSSEEYEEIIERAQEIVEDTPEGNIPLDEDYLGQYAQTCPLCGATFVTEEILEPGATCPICLEVPEAFVMVGRLEGDDAVAEKNGLVDSENEENKELGNEIPNEELPADDIDAFEDNDEDLERLERELASEAIRSSEDKLEEDNNLVESEDILEESKEIVEESIEESKEVIEEEKRLELSAIGDLDALRTAIETAENEEEIQNLIYSITNSTLEHEVQCSFDQCMEDGDDLDSIKDFVTVTLEDNAFLHDEWFKNNMKEEPLEEEREATRELVADENNVPVEKVDVEVVEESLEKKEELLIPDYEHVQEWTDKQVAEWIVDNFKEITHRDIEDVYNRPTEEDEETPLFKDEVIDETAPAIDDMISKLGFNGKRREEILYALDDCLVAHRNDNPAPVFNEEIEEEKVEEDKSALEKSMDALDEIEALANGDEELLKLGQEMGLEDFKKYLDAKNEAN